MDLWANMSRIRSGPSLSNHINPISRNRLEWVTWTTPGNGYGLKGGVESVGGAKHVQAVDPVKIKVQRKGH